MQIFDSNKITGPISRMIETRYHRIMNGLVHDKETLSPRTMKFATQSKGCPAVPNAKKWIAYYPAVNGIFEYQQNGDFFVDNVDSTITYIPINMWHRGVTNVYSKVGILKVRETASTIEILGVGEWAQATTDAYIEKILHQNDTYIAVLIGTSNTNRFYVQKVDKATLSTATTLLDVGVSKSFDHIGNNGTAMLFMDETLATAAGKWTLRIIDISTGTTTTVAYKTGYTSALSMYPTTPEKVNDTTYTQYRALISPTSPYNLEIYKLTYDLTKTTVAASTALVSSEVKLSSTDANWLPANYLAALKLFKTTASNGKKYLHGGKVQACVTTALAYGNIITWEIVTNEGVESLRYVGTSSVASAALVHGMLPLNNGRTVLVMTPASTVFLRFNETTELFEVAQEVANAPLSIAADDKENIWVTKSDFSVELYNSTFSNNVILAEVGTIPSPLPSEGYEHTISVKALDYLGNRLATNVTLNIGGTNAVFSSNSSKTLVVATSTAEDVNVLIKITDGGPLRVTPSAI